MSDAAPAVTVPSRWALFTAFFKIGALGFGGVAALARHVLVTERRFLDEGGFAEAFGLASTLPGANTVNLATMLGDRFRGMTGAAVCLLGLLGLPLAILVVAASFYDRFAGNADVKAGLAGAAAGAAGLVGGTALRILKGAGPDVTVIAIAAGVCVAAFLKVPILVLLGGAIPLSIGLGVLRRRSAP